MLTYVRTFGYIGILGDIAAVILATMAKISCKQSISTTARPFQRSAYVAPSTVATVSSVGYCFFAFITCRSQNYAVNDQL